MTRGFEAITQKLISVRYELIENAPRTPTQNNFKLYNVALEILKQGGNENFLKDFGDYFVEGYTWGLYYDATIPGKSYYLPKGHNNKNFTQQQLRTIK